MNMQPRAKEAFAKTDGYLVLEDRSENTYFIKAADIHLINSDDSHYGHNTHIVLKNSSEETEEYVFPVSCEIVFDCYQHAKQTGQSVDLRPVCNLENNSSTPRSKAKLIAKVKAYVPSTLSL